MLVLTFREDEDLYITLNGVEVKIKVVQTRLNKTKLGVTAPEEVRVERAIVRKKRKAS